MTAMPERLSLASDGWHTWHDSRISSSVAAGQIAFSVGKRPVVQAGVNAHFVCFILAQRRQLRVAQTKPPRRSVVGGAIRNPVRVIGQTEEMRTEFGQCHRGVYWHAVIDHMQVGLTEIDEALATGVFDEGIADMPFLRYGPIQHRCAARHLMESERNPLGNSLQSRTHTIARDATTERKQLRHKAVHGLAAFRRQGHQVVHSTRHHNTTPLKGVLLDAATIGLLADGAEVRRS